MRQLIRMSAVVALVALLTLFSSGASANEGFAAGSARISEPCKIQFDARENGGFVTEQCDFPDPVGKVLFAGPVLCYAASGNIATFVWQFQIAPYSEGYYQQVFIVDNGAPGRGVPDEFVNFSESPVNPCPVSVDDNPGTAPVLKGNFVVWSESDE